MKKMILSLMFAVAVSVNGFAQSEKSATVESVVNAVSGNVKNAPQGTVYGVTSESADEVVANTPLGKVRIGKKDGGYTFMGMYAKLVSHKGSVYVLETSLGKFKIDINKCTVTKL